MNKTTHQSADSKEHKLGQASHISDNKRLHATSMAEGFGGALSAEQILSIYEEMNRAVARDLNEQEHSFALVSPTEAVSRDTRTRELHVRWASAKKHQQHFTLNDAEAGILFDEIARLTAALNKTQTNPTSAKDIQEPVISNTATPVRILPQATPRVETGPVQFGDDWPGIFIRGDNAFHYAINLSLALDKVQTDPFVWATLKSLAHDLASSTISGVPETNDLPTNT